MAGPPAYNINDFIAACADPRRVAVFGQAQRDAGQHFNLPTKEAVCGFIANGGLESPRLAEGGKEWEKNPTPHIPMKVDSYGFYSGPRYGYIAFIESQTTGKWLIKSFKPNKDPDPRTSTALGRQIMKLLESKK